MPSKTLRIVTADGESEAFAAFPDDGERHPAVLLYPDAFGLRPVLEEMVRELALAGHGYYVLAPHFLYRDGPVPLVELPAHIGEEARPEILGKLMPSIEAHLGGGQAERDAGAYLQFLAAQPEVAAGPVGVVGYCIGGLLAVRTASAYPERVAAVAGFHSPVVAGGPDGLHGLLSPIRAEVHLGHAASDLTPEALGELNRALDAAGVRHTSEIYPGTVHGYTMRDTDAFDPVGLARHWDRLLSLLGRTLVSG
ncbi:dienelactone hydrolase family protein [Streptomyces sp. SCA2-2]|uniref:dienelactone hydrolase family protein n=1 Tax=Streptomyces sp. SCA2-2 TaxID=1563677 RepID=UPI00101FA6EE|nr:dienelactone hydrolase family protein [Streptomyces sp. SCA2-2]RZE99762.1 dienelactone hydrolase [Streptomyces sp. SCA2-2]